MTPCLAELQDRLAVFEASARHHTQKPLTEVSHDKNKQLYPGADFEPRSREGTVSNQLHKSPLTLRVTSQRAQPLGTLPLNNEANGISKAKAGSLQYKEAILKLETFFFRGKAHFLQRIFTICIGLFNRI